MKALLKLKNKKTEKEKEKKKVITVRKKDVKSVYLPPPPIYANGYLCLLSCGIFFL